MTFTPTKTPIHLEAITWENRPQALFPYAPPAVPREYGELNQKPGWQDGIRSHLWFMEYMIPPSHMLIIGVLTHPHISMLSGHIYIYIYSQWGFNQLIMR